MDRQETIGPVHSDDLEFTTPLVVADPGEEVGSGLVALLGRREADGTKPPGVSFTVFGPGVAVAVGPPAGGSKQLRARAHWEYCKENGLHSVSSGTDRNGHLAWATSWQ